MTSRAAILSLAFAIAAPTAASAQFTTFIAQPSAKIDSAKAAIVAETKARTDSVTRTTLTDMRAWVDSAAGVSSTSVQTDTLPEPVTNAPPPLPTPNNTTTSFSNGAVAPDTASALPLITILGLASLSLGIVMIAGRAGNRRGRV